MKAVDIVRQIASVLPKYTDSFTDSFSIESIVRVGTVITVETTASHSFRDSQYVYVYGIKQKNLVSSLTQIDGVATVTTTVNHDLTYGFSQSIEILGSDNNFDGTYTIDNVDTNKSATFSIDSELDVSATGTIYMIEDRYGYNGRFKITRISDTKFSYELDSEPLCEPYFTDAKVKGNVRITSAVSRNEIVNAYTKQSPDKYYAFVVLGDTTVSKDRKTVTDSNYDYSHGNFDVLLLQPFSVFVVVPTLNSTVVPRLERDNMEDLRIGLYKSLLGVKFDSGFISGETLGVTPTGDSTFDEFNGAYFVQEFSFQVPYRVTSGSEEDDNGDIVGIGDSSAFRSFDVSFINEDEQTLKKIEGDLPND